MRCVCIIPARGGSKRIPGKNMRMFLGKPIIAYAIEAALQSGIFEEVMVSTDDEKIAEIARQYGASVPFMRSAEAASDFATTDDVLKEVLREYEKLGKTFDYMCNLYPCTPLVTPQKLKDCYARLQASNADVAFPAIRFSSPPQRGFMMRDGVWVRMNPEHTYSRSQDIPPVFYDAGQYHFFKLETYFVRDGYSRIYEPYEISEMDAQDVDSADDWRLAEIKYKINHNLL